MSDRDAGQVPLMTEPVTRWLLRASASPSSTPADFVAELARVLNDEGHRIDRVSVWVPTLHPELWGQQVMWDPERGSRTILRAHDVTETSDYVGTPGEVIHRDRVPSLRVAVDCTETWGRSSVGSAPRGSSASGPCRGRDWPTHA